MMVLDVIAYDGVPEIDSSIRHFIEQRAGRGEIIVGCINLMILVAQNGSWNRQVLISLAWNDFVLGRVRFGFKSSKMSHLNGRSSTV